MNKKITIFLADDHKILRESLNMLLSQDGEFEVIGQGSDGIETEKLFAENPADILLLDVSMPKRSGFDVAKNLIRMYSDQKLCIRVKICLQRLLIVEQKGMF